LDLTIVVNTHLFHSSCQWFPAHIYTCSHWRGLYTWHCTDRGWGHTRRSL